MKPTTPKWIGLVLIMMGVLFCAAFYVAGGRLYTYELKGTAKFGTETLRICPWSLGGVVFLIAGGLFLALPHDEN